MFLIQNDKSARTRAVQMHTQNPQLLESKSGICQYGQPTMLLSSPLYSSLFAFRILEHKIISYRFWVLCIKDRAESAQEKVIQGCLKERNWKAFFIFLVREGMDQEKRETKEPDCVEGEIKCYKTLLWAICFHKMPHVTVHGIKRCSKHNYWFIWYYLTLTVCSTLAPGRF